MRKLANPFGHPTQVSTQVQLAPTCDYLPVLLTRALSPGQTESQVDASWKLGATCDSVWPGLECTCVDLRWLAMTFAHFGRHQICRQVKASFSPFGHPAQVNASWLTSITLLLANEIKDSLPLCDFVCTCGKTCEFVWPHSASLYASWTRVHLGLLAGL